jgi:hypothetical protein
MIASINMVGKMMICIADILHFWRRTWNDWSKSGALMEMNVQLHHVVSEFKGVMGMGIIRASWQVSVPQQRRHLVQQLMLAEHVAGLEHRAGEHELSRHRHRFALEAGDIQHIGIVDQLAISGRCRWVPVKPAT